MHIRTHRGLLPLALAIMGALLVSFAMTFADDNRASALTNCDVTHDGNDSEELAFLTLINDYRSQNGLGALTISTNLNRGSAWMTGDMATNNYFAHTDSLGRSAYQRAIDCGYPSGAGENLAAAAPGTRPKTPSMPGRTPPGTTPTCSASTTSRSASPLLPGRLAIRLVLGNHLRDYGRWLGRWRRRHRTDQHPFPPTSTPLPTNTPTPALPTATPTSMPPTSTPTTNQGGGQTTATPTPFVPTSTPATQPSNTATPSNSGSSATNTPAPPTVTPTATPTASATQAPASTPVPSAAGALSLPLSPGANLVAWPGDNVSPAQAFAGNSSIKVVYEWMPATGEWHRYFPGLPAYLNNLTRLNKGGAYWVIANQASQLRIAD